MSLLPVKMNKINEAAASISTISCNDGFINNTGRAHGYVLNNKRTKAKLLKGAKRSNNLDIERKDGCVNLLFDDGRLAVDKIVEQAQG